MTLPFVEINLSCSHFVLEKYQFFIQQNNAAQKVPSKPKQMKVKNEPDAIKRRHAK